MTNDLNEDQRPLTFTIEAPGFLKLGVDENDMVLLDRRQASKLLTYIAFRVGNLDAAGGRLRGKSDAGYVDGDLNVHIVNGMLHLELKTVESALDQQQAMLLSQTLAQVLGFLVWPGDDKPRGPFDLNAPEVIAAQQRATGVPRNILHP